MLYFKNGLAVALADGTKGHLGKSFTPCRRYPHGKFYYRGREGKKEKTGRV